MLGQSVAVAALLATTASAKYCQNVTVPVTISARNAVFGGLQTPITNLDATNFALAGTRQGSNGTALALTGYATVSGTYNISAKLCSPANTSSPASYNSSSSSLPPLQILTHGIGFDKTYWDLSYHNYNYSYINTALSAGYHTLSYDRLGIGNSSHGEPRDEIQSFLEVAALAAITNMARNGSLPGASGSYSKVVHVGHSFGSAQTYSLTAMYPNISDAIILTGFSMNASFVSLFNAGSAFEQAYLNQPLRFGNATQQQGLQTLLQLYPALQDLTAPVDFTTIQPLNYPPGYLTNSNAGTTNYLFLFNGYFDPQILYFAEAGKQPVTVGEGLTLSSLPMMNPFAGPALVFTGSNDLPYCGGNCTATGDPSIPDIPSQVSMNLPSASPFASYIQPTTGHGLNFHYNATAGYQQIQNFLASNGLSASSTAGNSTMKLRLRSL